jgi:hypothetical protein
MVAGARLNGEERHGTHAVQLGLRQVVELYERSGLAHRPYHEIAPCPRRADEISGFIQEVAFFQFSIDANHRVKYLAKILRRVGFPQSTLPLMSVLVTWILFDTTLANVSIIPLCFADCV